MVTLISRGIDEAGAKRFSARKGAPVPEIYLLGFNFYTVPYGWVIISAGNNRDDDDDLFPSSDAGFWYKEDS